jgi:RNA polymerase sigma-70 factor (ECF subfamily)
MLKIQEKLLIHQIKKGNQKAFAKFYDFYHERIYRFIFFRIADENLAQDLTNETFIKILDYLKQGKEIEDFQSFIYKVARNLIYDHYRKEDEVPIDEFIKENIKDEKDLIKEIEDKFTLEEIEKALLSLPSRYKEVIILRFIEDLAFKEIANILSLKEEHVRVLAHRGLKMLKEKLNK